MSDINKLKVRKRKKEKRHLRPRVCVGCQVEYQPKRGHQKYCTVECREKTYDKQRRWLPDPDTVTQEALHNVLQSYFKRVDSLPEHGEVLIKW
jgi:hypothetical protein